MRQYDEIFRDNAAWVAAKLAQDPAYFEKLSRGQNPEILYVGCSDSRVTAEDLMGPSPGRSSSNCGNGSTIWWS